MENAVLNRNFVRLCVLFLLHGMAMGAWFVPLGPVLDAHGLRSITPLAFATSAIAALISPLFFGAMADRRIAPSRVLAGLSFTTALTMTLVILALHMHAPAWLVLALIQMNALCLAPTWGLTNSIVLAELSNSKKQFGPIRAVATLGWIGGCCLVSALDADASVGALVVSLGVWLLLAIYTRQLPVTSKPLSGQHLTWKERFGLDALILLRDKRHRVVLLTVALFAIPLAAFYPFTPTHLRDLGMDHTSAWMSLGQITEVIAMLALPALLHRFSFKAILTTGLVFGLLRYLLCATGSKAGVIAGLSLHGFAFTLFFITVQIYLDQRIESVWRARAQALYSVMLSGLGNLFGYIGTGLWLAHTTQIGTTDWQLFWGGLAGAVCVVLVYFALVYRRLTSHSS